MTKKFSAAPPVKSLGEVAVVWFRRDLRLLDNEALTRAVRMAKPCVFIYVVDPWFYKQPETGWLQIKFLFESLAALHQSLRKYNNQLVILHGDTSTSITALLSKLHKQGYCPTLHFNKDIQVMYGRERDQAVKAFCTAEAIPVIESQNFFLLDDESKMDSWWKQYYEYQYAEPYKLPAIPVETEALRKFIAELAQINPDTIADDLEVTLPAPRHEMFIGGEDQARLVTYSFLKERVSGYRWKLSRPMLAQAGATSLLGPHLASGTISNRVVFQAAIGHMRKLQVARPKQSFDIKVYLDRLRWRDSFTQRLWFHPELMWQNRFPEFDELYKDEPLQGPQLEYFERWKAGETGFPLLDAAMKQLAQDGFINFRMRAMAATFLTINCGVSWHHGARHFMNCLVDGDIAINHWQWQMQAGITNPLSPIFRMYSPTKNFQDRDPDADYVHFWLPETAGKDVKTILSEAQPMLDFAATRKTNGKKVADIRKQIRERLLADKGLELKSAQTAHRIVTNYKAHSAQRYQQFKKSA